LFASLEGDKGVTFMKKRLFALLLTAFIATGSAFAINWKSYPTPLAKNAMILSPMLDLGYTAWASGMDSNHFMLGGTVAFDYCLPINFPLSVGLQVGFEGVMGQTLKGSAYIPVLARVAWHPNWGVKGLDTYVMVKVGFSHALNYGDMKDYAGSDMGNGAAFGVDAGVRYFFTKMIGVFGEVGYTDYLITKNGFAAYGNQFFSVGASFKFGGKK
jgi:hypothetical protein